MSGVNDLRVTDLADRWTTCHPRDDQPHTPWCDATMLASAVERILVARLADERERIAEAMGALGAHWSDCTFPDDACICEVGLFEVRKDAARIARNGGGR